MNLEEIKLSVVSYLDLIKKNDAKEIVNLFQKADFLNLNEVNFKSVKEESLCLILGVKDQQLMGFLTDGSEDLSKWTNETQFFYNSFQDFTGDELEVYLKNTNYEYDPKQPTQLKKEEVVNRMSDWNKNKMIWCKEVLKTDEVVRFFEIPTVNFQTQNKLNLGLISNSNQIDMIVDNGTGFFDMSRPVPPFKR